MENPSFGTRVGSTPVLFGPQATIFGDQELRQLRTALLQDSRNWILDVCSSLSEHWEALSVAIPELRHVHGKSLIDSLHECLRNGTMMHRAESLPSIVLTPLIVITHLLQYSMYVEFCKRLHGVSLYDDTELRSRVGIAGFCSGLLTAMAVSVSTDEEKFRTHGAVAIRLAMVVGAVLDAQDALDPEGELRSIAVAWDSEDGKCSVMRILENMPNVSATR